MQPQVALVVGSAMMLGAVVLFVIGGRMKLHLLTVPSEGVKKELLGLLQAFCVVLAAFLFMGGLIVLVWSAGQLRQG